MIMSSKHFRIFGCWSFHPLRQYVPTNIPCFIDRPWLMILAKNIRTKSKVHPSRLEQHNTQLLSPLIAEIQSIEDVQGKITRSSVFWSLKINCLQRLSTMNYRTTMQWVQCKDPCYNKHTHPYNISNNCSKVNLLMNPLAWPIYSSKKNIAICLVEYDDFTGEVGNIRLLWGCLPSKPSLLASIFKHWSG